MSASLDQVGKHLQDWGFPQLVPIFKGEYCVSAIVPSDITSILNASSLSKSVLENYDADKGLTYQGRVIVVHTVTDYLLNLSKEVKNCHFLTVSTKIKSVFPRESVGSYYIAPDPPSKPKSSGKLVNRYRNLKDRLYNLNAGSSPSTSRPATVDQGNDPYLQIAAGTGKLFDEFDAEKSKAAEEWLKTQNQPWPKVLESWSITAPHRLRVLITESNKCKVRGRKKGRKVTDEIEPKKVMAEYLAKWPILNHASGYQLFMQDFNIFYPDSENGLFMNWKSFENKVIALAHEQVRDVAGLNFLSMLQDNPTDDTRALVTCMLLPSVCQPSMVITPPKSSKCKPWKVSVLESREGFILHVTAFAALKDVLKNRDLKYKNYGLRTQPFIVVVGGTPSTITDYYVSISPRLYKVHNCLEALDACFKSIFALHAEYPEESEQLWLLIRRCVYKITCSYDNTSLQSFYDCYPRLV
ncbi:uncharacterized protein LOC127750053 [Frankliniella occidentalis]|uniref:Uncharacterized protein LOC127750053 n=1 Tax=Frankliniella occidentalis TaxID=133901 RepID=A0A9C6UCL2_FRAOC|nr:uncharacterized protein LOC127750053 [Frankliniella occidentalis]